ncbi:MAG: 6-carboxytetrahydropterin synthase [bacterium]
MKIAKEYKWEMGHRLTFHKGKCKNLHGHTYKMRVELTGECDVNGMVLDYYNIDDLIFPVLEELDHGVIVYKNDVDLINLLKVINSKHVILNNECTAENITKYILERIKKTAFPNNISSVKIRLYETGDAYAEDSVCL